MWKHAKNLDSNYQNIRCMQIICLLVKYLHYKQCTCLGRLADSKDFPCYIHRHQSNTFHCSPLYILAPSLLCIPQCLLCCMHHKRIFQDILLKKKFLTYLLSQTSHLPENKPGPQSSFLLSNSFDNLHRKLYLNKMSTWKAHLQW